jgi:hypothetical protein
MSIIIAGPLATRATRIRILGVLLPICFRKRIRKKQSAIGCRLEMI